ncbi:hypothetical protein D9M69_250710 [compost metagenome]
MVGAVADQAVQAAVHQGRHARAVAVEEEHQHQAQGQFEHAGTDLRAARQQPVADLAHVGLEAGEERRALLVDGGPQADQPAADQRHVVQPGRRRRQATQLHVLDQVHGVADVVGQVEAEHHQRHRHQQHPAQGEDRRRRRGVAIQPAGQQGHQRPAGEGQHGGPEQRRPERRQHPQAGGEQRQDQDLQQQAIVIWHGDTPGKTKTTVCSRWPSRRTGASRMAGEHARLVRRAHRLSGARRSSRVATLLVRTAHPTRAWPLPMNLQIASLLVP